MHLPKQSRALHCSVWMYISVWGGSAAGGGTASPTSYRPAARNSNRFCLSEHPSFATCSPILATSSLGHETLVDCLPHVQHFTDASHRFPCGTVPGRSRLSLPARLCPHRCFPLAASETRFYQQLQRRSRCLLYTGLILLIAPVGLWFPANSENFGL